MLKFAKRARHSSIPTIRDSSFPIRDSSSPIIAVKMPPYPKMRPYLDITGKVIIPIRYLPPHPFHIVDFSPWPLFCGLAVLSLTFSFVQTCHGFLSESTLYVSLGLLLIVLLQWFRDILREAVFEGCHSAAVQQGLRLGMLLFIASELLFFLGFFWAFFHSSLSPNVELGGVWPPKGLTVFDPWSIPFLNTLILLVSGSFVTWSHHSLLAGRYYQSISGLFFTICLAGVFLFVQFAEYKQAEFCLSDGIYGSTFFMTTGCHGLHVLIGTIFLFVCFLRLIRYQLTLEHHFGYESAIWYWHFVDVIWLFVFIALYWWGGY